MCLRDKENRMNKLTTILANGAFPESEKALSILKQSEFIICCDGAVNKLVAAGLEPDVIVGDLDSVSFDLKARFADKLISRPDQNYNDLTKSVMWAVENGFSDITIMGATGLREDHSIGNFFLLYDYSKMANVKMVTDFGTVTPINKTTTFNCEIGQQVSVFSVYRATKLTFTGLKYQVENRSFDYMWQGTLNETIDTKFTIEFDGQGILVYLLD